MLFDTRTPQESAGLKPNVDNSIHYAKATSGQKALYWILVIITLGFFAITLITVKNKLLREQNAIQEKSSLIQAAEKRRRATLMKQLDAVKGYALFENKTQTEIAALRSKMAALENENNPTVLKTELDKIQTGLNLQFEQYPNLKTDRMFLQFHQEIALQEDEIYSTIRLYNQQVRAFNSEIYTFYTVIIAERNKVYNMPLFQATELERKDVDTSSLASIF